MGFGLDWVRRGRIGGSRGIRHAMGLEKEGLCALKGKFGEGGVERKELLGEIAMCCSHCLRRRHRLIIWDWDL